MSGGGGEAHQLGIPVEGARLAVTYSPAGDAVLLVAHGASAGTRDHGLYWHLHDVLPPRGIGVATFDRRGEGASTGVPSLGDIDRQARDVLAIVTSLDVGRTGLWGWSQGGWVAPLAAARSDRIDWLVLVASTGVSPSEQMRYGVARNLVRGGFSGDAVEHAMDLRARIEAWIRAPDPAEAPTLEAALNASRDEPWWPEAYLPEQLPDADERRDWLAEMDMDPMPTFAATRAPTLLFYGALDEWTPVEPSLRAWSQARPDGVTSLVVPGVGHDLMLPDGTPAPAYERLLLAWLDDVVGGAGG